MMPDDPALPGLSWLLHRRRASLTLVKHRPGKRMVLRDAGPPPLFWKLYCNDRGARLSRRHRELEEHRRAGELRFAVPHPEGYWPDVRALALAAAAGTPIVDTPGPDLTRAAREAAVALRSLHASSWRPERTWSLADECGVVERAAQILAGAKVAPPARLSALVERIHGKLAAAWPGPVVPVHRDFHPAQVLWSPDSGISILDWDDAALGPPGLDVGNFAAHLKLEVHRRPARAADWRQAEETFLKCCLPMRSSTRAAGAGPFIAGTLFRLAGVAVERRGDRGEAGWLIEESSRP